MGDIKENQQAKLLFMTANGSAKELNYAIKQVYSDRISLVLPENSKNETIELQEGDDIIVSVITPFGVRQFESVVLEKLQNEELVVDYAQELVQEVQRRNYLRVNIETSVVLEHSYHSTIKTHTVDIGGGGLKIFSKKWLEPGEKITIQLFLPGHIEPVNAKGVIVKNEFNAMDNYSIMFTEIDSEDREKIIQTCFKLDMQKVQTNSRNSE